MDPDTYCQQKAAASGSNFTLSFSFLNHEQRLAMQAVYAFCREVDDIVDDAKTPEISRLKLAWWHDAVDSINSAPQHPICKALAPHIKHFKIPLSYFHDVITGMEMDLDLKIYDDELQLSKYCYHAAGAVGLIIVTILGYQDRQTLSFAKQLGEVLQRINILRDVIEDAERGRVYLPRETLAQYQLTSETLLSLDFNHDQQQRLHTMIRELAARTQSDYQQAMRCLPEVDRRNQRVGIIMGAIYNRLLSKIAAQPHLVLQERLRLSKLEQLWVLGKTVVGEWIKF